MLLSTATVETLRDVLSRFGVAARSISDIRSGRVNRHWRVADDDGAYVLRCYHARRTVAAIRYEHDVLRHLAGKGWPVAVPLPAAEGDTLLELQGERYALFPFLPGRPHSYRSKRYQRLKGHLLARLHEDLASWEAPGQREGFGRLWELDTFVAAHSPYATFNEVLMAFGQAYPELARPVRAQKYAMLRELSVLGYGELPCGLIHFDFHHDNLLFERGELTGLLDLDFVHLDARVVDIATTISSDLRAPPAYNEIDIDAVGAFLSGYVERAPLSEAEVQLIVPLVRAFVVWLVAWRLAHWAEGEAGDSPLRSIRRSVRARFPLFEQQRPALEAAVLQAVEEGRDR